MDSLAFSQMSSCADAAGAEAASQYSMDVPAPLLERSLLIVAHADDECLTYGALLQRIAHSSVVYCTDSAPHDPYFWKDRYGSRQAYAELRRQETRAALDHAGAIDIVFLADLPKAGGRLADQQLFRNLDLAFDLLSHAIVDCQPNALLTLAYEGGHPDHDSCNFLTAQLARNFAIPAYEAPLYTRAYSSESPHAGVQRFIRGDLPSIDIKPTKPELERKSRMCTSYPSQGNFLRIFDIRRELLRPLPEHDYSQPPHPGKLNYEVWQWSMTSADVCAAFSTFKAKHSVRTKQATGDSGHRL